MAVARNRSVEIYLKEGIEEDDRVFETWAALRTTGRPQDVFRRALREGLAVIAAAGGLSRPALAAWEGGEASVSIFPARPAVRRAPPQVVRKPIPEDDLLEASPQAQPLAGEPTDGAPRERKLRKLM